MKNICRLALGVLALSELTFSARAVEPPAPFGPLPSVRQLKRQDFDFYGFIHFGVNTFTDKEWGSGAEQESVFNPTDFDANQIASVAKAAGMKALILTCKHHDGFCLWPSAYTEHSVKNSVWKNGHGDVVREISDACRRHGLKFGVYLSPWDRNNASYSRPEYITYYRSQLRELLTRYGDIFEVWFDGANGGDGYYGGANEKREIDNRTYYDWANTWDIVRKLQPNACMFSDGGPDLRWVGDEDGRAGETCWATLNRADFFPGRADSDRLNSGDRPGTDWIPAECDVSIRPGWFYHAAEDKRVKTPKELMKLYFSSFGHGSSLLLNVPPNQQGKISEADVQSLREFHRLLETTFARDLARDAKASASNTRGNDRHYGPKNVIDDRRESYWSTDDAITNPELILSFPKPVTFDIIRLREYLPLGQRIDAFAVDQWQDGKWIEFTRGTSIGNCRLLRVEPVTTERVRLRIVKAAACPALSEFGLFGGPK